MGYFSNGTEGLCYQEEWCVRCANCGDEKSDFGCTVWDAHTLYCYSGTKEQKEILDLLIPRDGIDNGQCTMFREKSAAEKDE